MRGVSWCNYYWDGYPNLAASDSITSQYHISISLDLAEQHHVASTAAQNHFILHIHMLKPAEIGYSRIWSIELTSLHDHVHLP